MPAPMQMIGTAVYSISGQSHRLIEPPSSSPKPNTKHRAKGRLTTHPTR